MEQDIFKIYTTKMAKDVCDHMLKFEIKSIDPSNGTFKVIASDETLDRHWETLIASWCKFDNFAKNPIMLFGHNYREIEAIMGKCTRWYIENKQVILEWVFASAEANPNAQLVRHLYDEGIIKTVSVGLRVLKRNMDDSDIIEERELLECSFVPVPANPNALDAKDFETYLSKGFITKEIEGDKEEDKIPNDNAEIKAELKEIKETQSKILEFVKALADGNAQKLTDKTLEAKQALQDIDKTVGDALRSLKIS